METQVNAGYEIVIKPKRGRFMRATVVGIDSETCHGEPITIQLYSDDQPNLNACLFVTGENVTDKIFSHFSKKAKKGFYRIYGHHLKFDMISFFWPMYRELPNVEGIEVTVGDWHITGFYGTPSFVRARKDKIVIEIIDSFSWFATSLARNAQLYFPETPKLKRPAGLGTKKFTRKDDAFIEYAMQDAVIACKLGHMVEDMHHALQIKQRVSLASMSAEVFKVHFLKHEIIQTPDDFIKPALLAYHGGKNNVPPSMAPAWHTGVHSYDVSSAYPDAMRNLPGFAHESGYKEYAGLQRIRSVPECGVYRITGIVAKCNWPSLFHHNFKPINGETIKDIWVSGYELNEALSMGEIKLTAPVKGLYYETHKHEDLPLKNFSEHFYAEKEAATDPTMKFRSKIVLNALYGKFIQTKDAVVDDTDPENMIVGKVAAGLFQPLIASSITGRVRATMHYLEHETSAIHTATDGIFTYKKIDPTKLKRMPKTGLGSLKYEGSGTLALVRNKLYVLYADNPEDGEFNSNCFPGKRIKKYARHAFQGTLRDLEEFLANGKRKYIINKPNSLQDSINRGLVPNDFVQHEYNIRAGNLRVISKKESQKWLSEVDVARVVAGAKGGRVQSAAKPRSKR